MLLVKELDILLFWITHTNFSGYSLDTGYVTKKI